jgi:hypothetical protein
MVPWGHIAFIAIAIGGLIWTLKDPSGLGHDDYIEAVAAASGLVAVGHGIRRHREPMRSSSLDTREPR